MVPTWEDFLKEIFLDLRFNETGNGKKVSFLEGPKADNPYCSAEEAALLSVARRSQLGTCCRRLLWSAPPGGDPVPLYRHSADLPLQQLAGWEEGGWADRETALRDGVSQEEEAEK